MRLLLAYNINVLVDHTYHSMSGKILAIEVLEVQNIDVDDVTAST